jgi:hypothetical protein
MGKKAVNNIAIAAMLFVAVPLFGCALPMDEKSSELMAHVAKTTLPSGWRVDCLDDHHKAERMCFAGSFS